jgi:hypothetical protein
MRVTLIQGLLSSGEVLFLVKTPEIYRNIDLKSPLLDMVSTQMRAPATNKARLLINRRES